MGEAKKSRPQKTDSLSSRCPAEPLGPPFTSQSPSFVWAKLKVVQVLCGFAFKDQTNPQRSGLGFIFGWKFCYCMYKSTGICLDSWKLCEIKFSYFSLTKRPTLVFHQHILNWPVQAPFLNRELSHLHVPLFLLFPTALSVQSGLEQLFKRKALFLLRKVNGKQTKMLKQKGKVWDLELPPRISVFFLREAESPWVAFSSVPFQYLLDCPLCYGHGLLLSLLILCSVLERIKSASLDSASEEAFSN